MRTKRLAVTLTAAMALVTYLGTPGEVAAQGAVALSGVVNSAEEGNMEGVVVNARRNGGISTVSVVSDASGKYSFPRTHLEPGTYAITTRAVGFDLTDPGAVTVASGTATTTNLTLSKTKDLAAQLSSIEWINNMKGTPEQKDQMVHQLLSCNYCHTFQRIAKSKHSEERFMAVIDRMVKYYADGTAVSNDNKRGRAARIQEPGRVEFLEQSTDWGASPGYPREEVAKFWAMNNLGEGRTTHPYELTTTNPRPTGAATKIIVTEWDMPTASTASHDSTIDAQGVLWYTDESAQLLGKFDTKTATFKEYQMPAVPKGIIPGTRDVIAAKDGNIWLPIRNQTGASQLAVFDPKTEKLEWIEGANAQFIAEGPGGKIWAGWRRVDQKTRTLEGTFSPQATGVVPKGSNAYAGNAEIDSKGNPWMVTQIGPGGAMGFDMAANKGIWHPVEGLAGRRGSIDHEDRLWYGEYRTDKIAMVDTRTGKAQRWDLPTYAGPYTASHPDSKGRVYAPSNMAERLFRLDPKTNTIIAYQWPTEFDTKKINYDPTTDQTVLWFVNMRTARVSRVEVLD
jgi:virginiamycin B lyase